MKKIKSILLRFKKNKKADKVEDFLLPQDKNKIEKLAQKKQEYQKVIQQLDYQIELVQKSTKTLIPALAPAHHYLRSHFKWYYRWHIKPYTSIVHTVILLIYLISIPFMFLGGPGAVQKKAKAATAGNPYWEWLTPNPTTNPLLNVTSPDENTIWVTGRYGLIARATKETGESWTLNTVHWTQYDLGTTKSIIDIYVQDNNSIWVIGPDATLYYFNGLVWTNLVSDSGYLINNDLSMSNINISGEALNGISGSGDDVWVVGEGGLILHNNGTTWETQAPSTPTYLSICDVYASATNNVVAMGISNGSTQASIMQYNGSSWSYLTNPYGFAGHFPSICWHEAFYTKQVGVFTSSPTDIWISFWSQGGVVPEGEPNEEHGVDKNFIFQYDADAIHWDLMSAVDEPYGIIVDGRQTDDMVAISPNNDGVPRGINSTTNGWLDTTTAVNDGVTSGAWVNDNGEWKTVRVTKTGEVYVGGFNYSNQISQDNLSDFSGFKNITSSEKNLWIYDANRITKYNRDSASWEKYSLIYPNWNMREIYAQTDNILWGLGGSDGTGRFISKSNDGGQNFSRAYTPAGFTGSKIRAYGDRIWVVGDQDGKIAFYKTDNGGASWDEITTGITSYWNWIQSFSITSDSAWIKFYGEDGLNQVLQYNNDTSKKIYYEGDSNSKILALDSDIYLSVGTAIKKLNYTTSSWDTFSPVDFGSNSIKTLSGVDSSHIYALRSNGQVSWYNGAQWSHLQYMAADDLIGSIAIKDNDGNYHAYFAGNGSGRGIVAEFFRPAGSYANRIVAVAPGQDFDESTGVSGTPTPQRVGTNFSITLKAIGFSQGRSYKIDTTNTALVSISTNDPKDSHSNYVDLVNGQATITINNSSKSGTGGWTYNFIDSNGILQSTNLSVVVYPGLPDKVSLSSSGSIKAGQPHAITLKPRDSSDNDTWVDSDKAVTLSTNSSRGRFSTSTDGPWSDALSLTLPAGSNTNLSSASFWYLDFNTGNVTISASTPSLNSGSLSLNIETGEVSYSNVSITNTNPTAGETIGITVTLKNSPDTYLSSKNVCITSSRGSTIDNITPTQTTDGNGVANFNLTSTVAGAAVLSIRDLTDNFYLENEPLVTFFAGPFSQIIAEGEPNTIEAGKSFNLKLTLKDMYGNIVTDVTNTLLISSSDPQVVIPPSYTFTHKDSGTHTFSDIALKTAGTQTITAYSKSNPNISSTISINVTPSTPSATASYLKSDKNYIKPNGSDKAVISVVVTDEFRNGLANKNTQLFSNRAEDKIETYQAVTNEKGEAYYGITSTKEGFAELSAFDTTDNFAFSNSFRLRVSEATLMDILSSEQAKSIARTVAPIATAVAALGLLALIMNIIGAIPFAGQYFSYSLLWVLQTFRIRRKSRQWGIVFDSITGRPIDLATLRLFNCDNYKLVSTQLSDISGQFGFTVEPGRYSVSVSKKGYVFPTNPGTNPLVKKMWKSSSQMSDSWYVGQPIEVKEKDTRLNLSIPMDPAITTPSAKLIRLTRNAADWIVYVFSFAIIPLMALGLVFSIFSTIILKTWPQYLMMGLYALGLGYYIVMQRRKINQYGFVFDSKTLKPIEGATIYVYEQKYDTMKMAQMTDKTGRFSVLLPKGEYYLTIEAKGYTFPSKHVDFKNFKKIYQNEIIKIEKTQFINVEIPLDPK